MEINKIYCGDSLETLKTFPDECIDCCITSPPYYGLRDYGVDGQIGLEDTPEEFIQRLVEVFREVKRVLKPKGTLWVNIGDTYCSTAPGQMGDNIHIEGTLEATRRARKTRKPKTPDGCKPKDLMGIPWMLAFALRSDGWYLRQDIIWNKPNPMPESVTDRCTKAHEYIFLLSKSQRYYYDAEAIKEPVQYFGDNTGVGFGHGTDKSERCRDRIKQNYRVPAGWDTDAGSHGAIHRTGRARYGGNKYTADPDQFYRTKSENAYEPRDKRNKRDVWTIATQAFKEAHFATFPEELVQPCIMAGCPEGGTALDPFFGSGTTGLVAAKNFRNFVGIELNSDYIKIADKRIKPYLAQVDMFACGVERI